MPASIGCAVAEGRCAALRWNLAGMSPLESLRGAGLLPGATLAGGGQITNGRIRLRVPSAGKPAIEQMKLLFLDQVELTLMGFPAMPVRGQRYRVGQPGPADRSA